MGYREVLMADRVYDAWPLGMTNTALTDIGINSGTVIGMVHVNAPALGRPGIPAGDPEAAITYASASSQYSHTSASLLIDPTAPPWSFELWFKTTVSSGFQAIACMRNTFNDNSGNCFIVGTDIANAGDVCLFYTTLGDTSSHITSTAHTYNDGLWHHVVGTCTAGFLVSLYVDGVLQTTGSGQNASTSGAAQVNLGANVTSAGPIQFFDGTVAWPAAYQYALNADQVRRHYLAGRWSIFPKGDPGARRRRR